MKELYNRVSSLEFAREITLSNTAVFIYEVPNWQKKQEDKNNRGFQCRESIQPTHLISLQYCQQGIDEETMIQESFTATFDSGEQEKYISLDVETMKCFIDKVYARYKSLILDITLINNRLLGAFFAVLPDYDWENIYVCYTEPKQYMRMNATDGRNEGMRFDLKYSMQGFEEIPNLKTFGDNSADCEWIIFMGFEGTRLKKLNTEVRPNGKYIIPVMCIPSMHIEWHNYAMEANIDYLNGIVRSDNDEAGGLEYVSAINPFEVYNFLVKEKENQQVRLKISPVGTKLTVLGSIMYVIENMDDMILTDNPYQEDENSIEYGNSYLYDLTYFVKQAENKRFERRRN